MKTFPLANANASVIAVTGTATYLLRLIDTAGSANHAFPSNLDAINITPEDGDIRIFTDNTTAAIAPTASKGFLIRQGSTFMLRRTSLRYIKAIAVTGTVACSVEIGAAEQEEISSMAGGSGAINSVIPGTGATNLGKAEDSVHSSGDVGVMGLAVRRDTPTALGADGDYVPQIVDANNLTFVTLGTKIAGEDQTNDVIKAEMQGTFQNITTQTTTTVKSGAGLLHAIILNTPVASAVVTIYDNTAASGTLIGTITLPATLLSSGPITVLINGKFATGCTIVTSGATMNITSVVR